MQYKTELEYLQFHMGKEHPELATMTPQYVNCGSDNSTPTWGVMDAIEEVGNAVGAAN